MCRWQRKKRDLLGPRVIPAFDHAVRHHLAHRGNGSAAEGAGLLSAADLVHRVAPLHPPARLAHRRPTRLHWIHIHRNLDSHFPYVQYPVIEIQERLNTRLFSFEAFVNKSLLHEKLTRKVTMIERYLYSNWRRSFAKGYCWNIFHIIIIMKCLAFNY